MGESTWSVRVVDQYDEAVFKDLVARNLEAAGVFIPAWDYYSEGDDSFHPTRHHIRIGAFDGDELIGLSCGTAASRSRFTMNMSLVEEAYRSRGLYSRMLSLMLHETAAYDEIDSYHHVLNNRIIAAKLKRDFYIVGMDNSIMVGPRVLLRYYHNEKLLDLMKFRAGLTADPRL